MVIGNWRANKEAREARKAFQALPDGLWVQCQSCSQTIFAKDMVKNLQVCPKCGHHHRISARQRLVITMDGDLQETNHHLVSLNPLEFPDYSTKLAIAKAKTDTEGIVTGIGKIGGYEVCIGIMDWDCMGGSMGSVVGEKFASLVETAIVRHLPLIAFTTSGGARMQEGIISLMQMPKTCVAIGRLQKAGLPYFAVFTHPTTAGVLASFASVADVIISEPAAMVAFAGDRVSQQAQVDANAPADFKTAEFQHRQGMIDIIVERKEIRTTLTNLLRFAGGAR